MLLLVLLNTRETLPKIASGPPKIAQKSPAHNARARSSLPRREHTARPMHSFRSRTPQKYTVGSYIRILHRSVAAYSSTAA
eukprot:801850-Rhodomonas_salina.3